EFVIFTEERPPVDVAAFSPDGGVLAFGSGADGKVHLWERASGKDVASFGKHDGLRGVAFSPDDRLLASWGWEGPVRLWDPATGTELGQLNGHRGGVSSAAFSANGALLASAGWDTSAVVWDVKPWLKEGPARQLAAGELESLWADLAGGDAAKAYRAAATLVA